MASFAEFQEALKRFGFVAGLVGAGSVLTPLVTAAAGFAPPVFEGLPYLTTLFMLVALIVCFSLAQGLSKRGFKRLILFAAVGFIALTFGYLMTLDRFVHHNPTDGGKRVIVGCELKPDILNYVDEAKSQTSHCPGDSKFVKDMLYDAKGDPDNIWTSDSIRNVVLGLLGLWMGMFAALTVLVTGFVGSLKDKRRKPVA